MSKKKSSNKSSRYDMGVWTDEDETSLSQIHNLLKKYGNVFKIDMKGHGKDVWVSDKKGIDIDEGVEFLRKFGVQVEHLEPASDLPHTDIISPIH